MQQGQHRLHLLLLKQHLLGSTAQAKEAHTQACSSSSKATATSFFNSCNHSFECYRRITLRTIPLRGQHKCKERSPLWALFGFLLCCLMSYLSCALIFRIPLFFFFCMWYECVITKLSSLLNQDLVPMNMGQRGNISYVFPVTRFQCLGWSMLTEILLISFQGKKLGMFAQICSASLSID